MTVLREIGLGDPTRSLDLARQGDAKFGATRDAAERGWYAARALVDLKRTSEAVIQARILIARYPTSSFALDVARHLLTHPLSDPEEVGHAEGR